VSANLNDMNIAELDYHLPQRLIAQQPVAVRTQSRLLVLDRANSSLEHRRFCDIVDYFQPSDCLVINDSKVIPARFYVHRATGGRIEGLFLNITDQGRWQVLLKNASRLTPCEIVTLADPHRQYQPVANHKFAVIESQNQGNWLLQPQFGETFLDVLGRYGITPLPPYIHRSPGNCQENESIDHNRYQTVYADKPGSVAAPTAGLHFSEDLLKNLQNRNIKIARLTLHVGLGTFRPITTEKLEDHKMHTEFYQLDAANAAIINDSLQNASRIIAVGTTSLRTLETIAQIAQDRCVQPAQGWTDLFITPGYQFRIIDALITNFHLPRTSLLALVCAFAGTERIMTAYRTAIEQEYRFYSYGDAMLIL